jgi:hypothetical protein
MGRKTEKAEPTMTTEKKGLLERSRQNKPLIRKQFQKILQELGIEGKPIPARQLQAMIRAEGQLEPDEISRGIIEMREE